MNITFPSPTAAELEKFSCLQISHTSTVVLRVRADDGRNYLFSTAHYVDGIHEANSSAKTDGPPERLRLRFTSGEIVILGSGLEKIGDPLATGHLLGLRTAEPRYAAVLKRHPIILSITVSQKEEV